MCYGQNKNSMQKPISDFYQQAVSIRGQFTLQDWDLLGKVKELSTTDFNTAADTIPAQENIIYNIKHLFNSMGKLYAIRSERYNTNINYRTNDGAPESISGDDSVTYFYDEQNRLIKVKGKNEIKTYTYNSINLIEKETKKVTNEGIPDEIGGKVEYTYGQINLQGSYPLTGLVSERIFKYSTDKQTVTSKYDSTGRIIQEKNKNWSLPDYSVEYKMKYNIYGDMIEYTQIATDATQIYTYEYVYDNQNNWTKRTEKRSSYEVVTARKIIYY